jgi:galactonate dehydratase
MLRSLRTLRPAVNPNLLMLELMDDNGLVGLGETFFGAAAVETYLHEITATLLFESGCDLTPGAVGAVLRSYVGYQGAGVETRANSAVDIATWDLLGKRSGRPLHELLGGRVREAVQIYNTCAGPGYVSTTGRQHSSNWGLNAGNDLDDLNRFLTEPAALAKELIAEGIPAMKIWPFDVAAEKSGGEFIGAQDLAEGCRIVREIRDAVGDEIDIMIEMHGLWNLPSAIAICRALEPFSLKWVEDPIRPDAVSALGSLKAQTTVPIATGETLAGRRAYLPLLQRGAIDYAIVDLTWTGGLTEAVKVAALAEAFAIPTAPHDCTGPIALTAGTHFSMTQSNVAYQETVRSFYRGWYPSLVDGLPEIRSGQISVSDRPGLGLTLHPDLAEQDSVITRTTTRKTIS